MSDVIIKIEGLEKTYITGLDKLTIIKSLDLRKPVFKPTAAYGHFGYKRFSWEQTDRVDDLKKYL